MTSIKEFQELMTKKEPVCPELAPYVFDGPFGPMLKHPLVFDVIGFDPERAARLNLQFREKSKYVKQAMKDKEWSKAIIMHERPHRLEFFSKISHRMTNEDYWKNLGFIISDSENLWQYDILVRCLLCNPKRKSTRHFIMEKEDRDKFLELPDELHIWRGCRFENRNGLSWSLSKDKAVWFAKRFNVNSPKLHSGTIAKSDAIAYFSGRGEEEIIAIHTKIQDKKLEDL